MSSQASPAPAVLIRNYSALSAPLASLIARYQNGSVPQALMLSGPFGVGKRTLAKLLSLCLFCQADDAPCGVCKACKRLNAETHPNLLVVRAKPGEKSIKIDQVRDMLAQLKSYPLEKGRRTVILEDFDLFTVPAQNALLKAIEEPDAATVYVLTTTNEKAVLPTILSRCLLQRLPAWPDAMVVDFLHNNGLFDQEVRKLVPLASGSPGTALLLEHDEDFWALKAKADQAITALKDLSGLPEASDQLKDLRLDANQLFDYLEVRAHADFARSKPLSPEAKRKHRAMLEAIFLARRQRASNVSWQGIADQMLLNISEEYLSCP
ncbi:MAG: hypothetical protein ACOX6Y_00685 [Christensenellales bacterium]|jgi:hypothetical protein